MTFLAIALALVGAVGIALGAERQQGAVRAGSGGEPLGLATVRRLARSGRWLAGLALAGLGTGLHAVALALAPVTVIQPVGVIALVITSVLNARSRRLRFPRSAVLSIVACTVGVGLFVTCASLVTTDRSVSLAQERLVLTVLLSAVAVLGLLAVAGRRRRSRRGMLNIVCGATLYGCVAVMMRLFTQHIVHGRWDLYTWLLIPGIAVGVVLGGWFVQSAYTKAPPDLVVAGLTVIDPLVAVTLGITVLGEATGMTVAALLALLGCGALAVVGVFVLSRFHPDATGHGEPLLTGTAADLGADRPARPAEQ